MSFSEATLIKKIQDVSNTQQSIQTLSLWLIHHRKNSKLIVQTWLKELLISNKCDRKITFIYLANDILQNSRKKGNEFMKEFLNLLPDAIENTSKMADSKTRFTLERIFNIWKDRKIYPDETIKKLKTILHSQPKVDENVNDSLENDQTKKTINNKTPNKNNKSDNDKKENEKEQKIPQTKRKVNESENSNESGFKSQKNSLTDEVFKELANSQVNSNSVQAPEPLDLIKMLQDLEKSASSDAVIRQKIAELPAQVIDANAIKNLQDKKLAAELLKSVDEAVEVCDGYNSRLQHELASRKQTALLLAAYIQQSRKENENDQKLIENWQKKLKQVKNVENELQIHLKSLPDLSTIEEAATLTPLPSAGDLFSSNII